MGDLNSAINEEVSEGTYTAKKVLAWEAEEKVIIPNDKTIPTRVNPKKGEKSNTLNLPIKTPKLQDHVKILQYILRENGLQHYVIKRILEMDAIA